jgi:nicotine blue oxidoreductase
LLGGESLARRGITLLRAGGATPVIVVTGAARLNATELADASVVSVHNPRWQTGMGSSLAVGLAAVPEDCPAAVLALADQPLIGAEAVRRLIAAYAAGASLVVACYGGQPRNPVLIGREHWTEVARMATGDAGARPFLRAHPDLVASVECADTGRPDDIDTPEDLARVAALLGPSAPFPGESTPSS